MKSTRLVKGRVFTGFEPVCVFVRVCFDLVGCSREAHCQVQKVMRRWREGFTQWETCVISVPIISNRGKTSKWYPK